MLIIYSLTKNDAMSNITTNPVKVLPTLADLNVFFDLL